MQQAESPLGIRGCIKLQKGKCNVELTFVYYMKKALIVFKLRFQNDKDICSSMSFVNITAEMLC